MCVLHPSPQVHAVVELITLAARVLNSEEARLSTASDALLAVVLILLALSVVMLGLLTTVHGLIKQVKLGFSENRYLLAVHALLLKAKQYVSKEHNAPSHRPPSSI